MKIISKYMSMLFLLGIAGMTFSCKEDNTLENVKAKDHGGLVVTILDGQKPVANTKVIILDANTDAQVNDVVSDSNGLIDLGQMIEGTYGFSFESTDPYAVVYQEFQVITGLNKEETIQLEDHVGSLTYYLMEQSSNSTRLIEYDLNSGIALIPHSKAYFNAINENQRKELAIIKKFDAGKAIFNNIPVGTYDVYNVIDGDSLTSKISGYEYIGKGDNELLKIQKNEIQERLLKKETWTIKATYNNAGEEIESPGFKTIRFFKNSYNSSYEVIMEDESVFANSFYFYSSSNGYSFYSSNSGYKTLYINGDEFEINEAGQIVMKAFYLEIYDNLSNSDLYFQSNISLVLE